MQVHIEKWEKVKDNSNICEDDVVVNNDVNDNEKEDVNIQAALSLSIKIRAETFFSPQMRDFKGLQHEIFELCFFINQEPHGSRFTPKFFSNLTMIARIYLRKSENPERNHFLEK